MHVLDRSISELTTESISLARPPPVQAETGFRTSAGISCSKMLAKLVSGIHKPDDQTVMLPCHAAAFVATLPVRAIPGQDCLGQQYSYSLRDDLMPHSPQVEGLVRGCSAAYLGLKTREARLRHCACSVLPPCQYELLIRPGESARSIAS